MEPELQRKLEEARSAWPGVSLSHTLFAQAIERHRPPTDSAAAWLARVRAADLYLATACAQGDPDALAYLDARFLAQIGETVRRIDGSTSFIDEVRQELRFHLLVQRDDGAAARISSYSGRGSLTSWVNVAAARLAVTMKRRAAPDVSVDPSLEAQFVDEATGPDLAYLRRCYRDDLQWAFRQTLGELTARQRSILRMHFIDGVPLERLAAMYDTHRTTLGRWVSQTCEQILSGTRKRLGARLQLPAKTTDSIVDLLRSHIELTASLLLTETE